VNIKYYDTIIICFVANCKLSVRSSLYFVMYCFSVTTIPDTTRVSWRCLFDVSVYIWNLEDVFFRGFFFICNIGHFLSDVK